MTNIPKAYVSFATEEQRTLWDQDIATLKYLLNIETITHTVRTVIRLAAQMAHKLVVYSDTPPNVYRIDMPSTGESALIYPGKADTWTLQIGPDPLNVVERLDSLDEAVKLVMNAN